MLLHLLLALSLSTPVAGDSILPQGSEEYVVEEEGGAPVLRADVAIPAGGAALATVGAYFFQVNARKAVVELDVQNFKTEQELNDYVASIKTQELVSFGFLAVAVGLAGYATWLNFQPAPGAKVALWVTPGGVVLGGTFE